MSSDRPQRFGFDATRPALLGCPHCNKPVAVDRGGAMFLAPEYCVCPHCHGVSMDAMGNLRKLTPAEYAGADWASYRVVCRQLTADHGAPSIQPCPTPPPATAGIDWDEYRRELAERGAAVQRASREQIKKDWQH